jgi:hypothetical protein
MGKIISCPKDGISGKDIEILGKGKIACCQIMIAQNRMHSDISGQFDTLIGACIIPNKVPKIQNSVGLVLKIINNCLKSLYICVDI